MNQQFSLAKLTETATIIGLLVSIVALLVGICGMIGTWLGLIPAFGLWPPKVPTKISDIQSTVTPRLTPTVALTPVVDTPWQSVTYTKPSDTPRSTALPTTKPPDIPRPTATFTPKPIDTLRPTATPLPGTTKVSADGVQMVYVPAGEFTMGVNDYVLETFLKTCANCKREWFTNEKPEHLVFLDGFWIDKFEVTNSQFQRFVEAKKYTTDAEREGWAYVFIDPSWNKITGANWRAPSGPGSNIDSKMNHPVVQVSWNDASMYCASVGKRLPTEAEWEKAARGTTTNIYPWGNILDGTRLNFCDRTCSFSWKDNKTSDGYVTTAPVGSFPSGASPYSAMDMAGNVWEWVADWYDASYYSSQSVRNPKGPSSGLYHVLRGGAWDCEAHDVRVSRRVDFYLPSPRTFNVGFRCVE